MVDSAARAGYTASTNDGMRIQGSRADKTTAVTELLAYAHAETGQGDNQVVNSSEAQQILSRIARKADVNARIKALESLAKLDARTGADVDTSKLFPDGQLYFHILSSCCDGKSSKDFWPIVWMELALRDWWSPLIRIMAPFCKHHYPKLWDRARNKLKYDPVKLKANEDGPLLTADQIFDACRKNLIPLLRVLDGNTMPELRCAAERDLISVGLMDPPRAHLWLDSVARLSPDELAALLYLGYLPAGDLVVTRKIVSESEPLPKEERE